MPDQLPFSETLANAPPAEDRPGFVRIGKDTLHAMELVVAYDQLGGQVKKKFTEEELAAYVARFYEHKEAGIPHPLRWGHGPKPGDTDERQSVADIADVWADNGKLYFAVYVTPEDALMLKKKQRPCSPSLMPEWEDGTGKVWPGYSLTHIAMVSHATVPNQLPFIQMGLKGPAPKGKKKMPVTFETMVAGVNRLFDRVKPGAGLATEGDNAVTEDNFDVLFPAIVDAILGADAEEPEPEEEETPVADPAAPIDPLLMALTSKFDALNARLDALTAKETASAEAEFAAAVDALCEGGLAAKNKPILMGLGKKNNWDAEILAPYADAPALLLGSKTKGLKSAKEPNGPGISEADRAAARKLRGIKEKKAAAA